ncbi:MAG: hypothetical protein JW841_09645 [Deltaproteobacteria bacterium]|nr:hypothetical protein [Deltaproteobacteria bacterium]
MVTDPTQAAGTQPTSNVSTNFGKGYEKQGWWISIKKTNEKFYAPFDLYDNIIPDIKGSRQFTAELSEYEVSAYVNDYRKTRELIAKYELNDNSAVNSGASLIFDPRLAEVAEKTVELKYILKSVLDDNFGYRAAELSVKDFNKDILPSEKTELNALCNHEGILVARYSAAVHRTLAQAKFSNLPPKHKVLLKALNGDVTCIKKIEKLSNKSIYKYAFDMYSQIVISNSNQGYSEFQNGLYSDHSVHDDYNYKNTYHISPTDTATKKIEIPAPKKQK